MLTTLLSPGYTGRIVFIAKTQIMLISGFTTSSGSENPEPAGSYLPGGRQHDRETETGRKEFSNGIIQATSQTVWILGNAQTQGWHGTHP